MGLRSRVIACDSLIASRTKECSMTASRTTEALKIPAIAAADAALPA
jgi:hypothetical protein